MMESIGTNAVAIEVLLVEDSPGDVRLTREAFNDAKVHINLHVASDGAEAMAFLGRDRPNTGTTMALKDANRNRLVSLVTFPVLLHGLTSPDLEDQAS